MYSHWLLIGDISGKVICGVDESFYVFGIYGSEEQAIIEKEIFEKSNGVFIDANEYKLYEGFGGMINSTDDPVEEIKDPIKYKDFYYKVIPFDGEPMFCGGVTYLE